MQEMTTSRIIIGTSIKPNQLVLTLKEQFKQISNYLKAHHSSYSITYSETSFLYFSPYEPYSTLSPPSL